MKKLLKAFGASDKESNVFLKLLELGAQPVSIIAKYTGIPRPSMYVILERLKKLQLVEEFKRYGIKYVKCISVNDMNDLIKLKERNLNQLSELLSSSKSELLSMENKLSSTPLVRFYQGKIEVMKMYEKVLKNGEFCAVFNPKMVKKMMPEYHYKIGETIKKAKELMVDSPDALEYKKLFKSKLHQIKILPKSMYFESDIIIQKQELYMVSYGETDLTGTEITNNSLVKTHQILFNSLWGNF